MSEEEKNEAQQNPYTTLHRIAQRRVLVERLLIEATEMKKHIHWLYHTRMFIALLVIERSYLLVPRVLAWDSRHFRGAHPFIVKKSDATCLLVMA